MARIIGKGYSYDDVLIIPKYNTIQSRKDVSFKTKVTKNYSIDTPFVIPDMDSVSESTMAITIGKLGGLGQIHRFLTIEEQVSQLKKVQEAGILVAAAVGVKDVKERVPKLAQAGIKILILDISHAHSKMAGEALEWIKSVYPRIDVMVGNIATKEAAEYFMKKGADAIKIGVGPGSMCTTRIMTGAGVPQITAIMNAFEATQGKIPICADGGIKYPGDVVKAIGAGADTVMIGSVISGTDECPGEIIVKDGKKYKEYRGMASYDATLRRKKLGGESSEVISVEGERTLVECKGPVEQIIKKFLGGLASGMTYQGASKIDDFKGKSDFIEMSPQGLNESHAHNGGNKIIRN